MREEAPGSGPGPDGGPPGGSGGLCRHLIAVAGLPCSGKSFLISALEGGGAPSLAPALRIGPHAQFRTCAGHEIDSLTFEARDRILLHLDLNVQNWIEDEALASLVVRSRRVTFLTVMVPVAVLRARHRRRISSFVRSLRHADTWRRGDVWRRTRRHARLFNIYRHDAGVRKRYLEWVLEALDTGYEHWLVDATDHEFRAQRVGSGDEARLLV